MKLIYVLNGQPHAVDDVEQVIVGGLLLPAPHGIGDRVATTPQPVMMTITPTSVCSAPDESMPATSQVEQWARDILGHAANHYEQEGHRWDVVVECMGRDEIMQELVSNGVKSYADALTLFTDVARLQHEQARNQAWGGPDESPE